MSDNPDAIVIYALPSEAFEPKAFLACKRANELGRPVILRPPSRRGDEFWGRIVKPGTKPEQVVNSLWNEMVDRAPRWKVWFYGWQKREGALPACAMIPPPGDVSGLPKNATIPAAPLFGAPLRRGQQDTPWGSIGGTPRDRPDPYADPVK